jgi:glycosyltransferase involved in cell wall biosynthesis
VKIGIDAKWLFEGPPSGRIVIRNIVKNLLANDKNNEYYIFLKNSDSNQKFPFMERNVTTMHIPGYNNLIVNLFILPKYIKRYGIDVMLYQNFPPLSKPSKSINYIHDVLFFDFPQYYSFIERIYLSPIKLLSRRADWIITISQNEKERLISHNVASKDKISVVYHGVDRTFSENLSQSNIKKLNFRKKYGLPEEYILYLGRLNERKNIYNLLKAMEISTFNTPLVVAGKVDHKMFDIQNMVQRDSLKDKVILTDYISDEDLPLLYKLAKIFCFPSFAEGFGLPPVEAMASGVPVVVSKSTCLPEICGDAAIYIDPHDPKDIAYKINALLSDEEMSNNLIKKGFERSKLYDWEISAKKIIKIIEEVNEN